jgi:hypothetical protein
MGASVGKPAPARFEKVSQPYGSTHRRAYRIACSACPETLDLHEAYGEAQIDERLTRKFAARGWVVGSSARRDLCPACGAKPKARLPDIPAHPAPPPDEAPAMPAAIHQVPPAAAPPAPTREDRQTIHAAIDARWNAGRECWAQAFSDKAVGELLDLPWAWVAEVRAAFFGERDINEATIDGVAAAGELEARGEALQARLVDLDGEVTKYLADVRAWRKAAGA